MKYSVTHSTSFSYTEAVPVCRNIVHLAPRQSDRQNCRDFRMLISPPPHDSGQRVDYFGNRVNYFSILKAHKRLTVSARSQVDVHPRPQPDPTGSPTWQQLVESLPRDRTPPGLEAYQYTLDSPGITRSVELAQFAQSSFQPGCPVLQGALDLTQRIHQQFTYDATATTIHTPLSEVLEKRRGVCQDFAHLQIGCLRSIGLAARYVSGYLRTQPPAGKPRLVGADASHAWVSVYCGPLGWVDFGSTNNAMVNSEHIQVAWAGNYSDVCPIQGVFVGGGQHTMNVSVDVVPL